MKTHRIFTDNSDLYDADKAVKDFVKGHSKQLSNKERDELGGLLNRRAEAISKVLGVKVGSVAE